MAVHFGLFSKKLIWSPCLAEQLSGKKSVRLLNAGDKNCGGH
jgi:hypothetical protein